MQFDPERVRANVARAGTEDLLDRVTVYRAGIEAEALAIIEEELRTRGVGAAELADHARRREGALQGADLAVKCAHCSRPAVLRTWGWHRLWGVLPVFPRRLALCEVHRP
jgi:ATP-dependent helicase YprA (DUF1998 family)